MLYVRDLRYDSSCTVGAVSYLALQLPAVGRLLATLRIHRRHQLLLAGGQTHTLASLLNQPTYVSSTNRFQYQSDHNKCTGSQDHTTPITATDAIFEISAPIVITETVLFSLGIALASSYLSAAMATRACTGDLQLYKTVPTR